MIPYILLLIFVVAVAHLGRISNNKVINRFCIGVVIIALVAFAGLRSVQVGTDTGTYRYVFLNSDGRESVFQNEVGYGFLSWAVRSWTESFAVMLTATAAIVVLCYVVTIIRTTRRYETALFIFITLGSYTFFFNGARQGIAAAICFAALPFLLQRRMIPYLLTVAFAATFHQTALIAMMLYPLASSRVDWKRLAMLLTATITLVTFLQVFVNFAANVLDDKFAAYAEEGEGGGAVWVAFLVGQGVVLYLFKNVVRDGHGHYERLLNIYLMGLVPALASTLSGVNPSGLLRLHLYFSSVSIIMWPIAFFYLKNTPNRFMVSIGFIVITLILFVLTTSAFGNLTPYRLNPEIVS